MKEGSESNPTRADAGKAGASLRTGGVGGVKPVQDGFPGSVG